MVKWRSRISNGGRCCIVKFSQNSSLTETEIFPTLMRDEWIKSMKLLIQSPLHVNVV